MNKYLNNLELFKSRFLRLYNIIEDNVQQTLHKSLKDLKLEDLYPLDTARNGEYTLSINNLKLHSYFNPGEEASKIVENSLKEEKRVCLLGLGLGYTAVKLPSRIHNLIVIEKEVLLFLLFLQIQDLSNFFSIKNLVLCLDTREEDVISLLNQHKMQDTCFIRNKALMASDYYNNINELIKRNINKEKINSSTTKRFGTLWLKNTMKNLPTIMNLEGVNKYKTAFLGKPFLVIASGPSLEESLPYMKELNKRCITVAVDSSLRALLSHGIEPDFIAITDPQYYAYLHIGGLESKSSTLIVSPEVYPEVFKFKAREIISIKSYLPLGSYFDKFNPKGDLGSGGSVSSICYSFAEYAGASTIYVTGLDLSFPERMSHIRGSTFERESLMKCNKLSSPDKLNLPQLFSADPVIKYNYEGKEVLTDKRMLLFSWWFESRIKASTLKTYTLNRKGLKINGIEPINIEEVLKLPIINKTPAFCKDGLERHREDFYKDYNKLKEAIKTHNLSYEEVSQYLEKL